ncbi:MULTISPECIES: DUF501 domain-containing protein [Jonquetella]|nr:MULTISPECIES: DUF501 domain-containing protein [Jonquetella]EEX48409.1 hypothetical protein GCWU000246_01058 [Jonquetella anthropi E3_33 E1]
MASRRFNERALIGVGSYCSWGYPQVIVCRPLVGARPFPTSFWLTCPWLVKQCGCLESAGGVGQLEAFLADRGAQWRDYQRRYAAFRLSLLLPHQEAFLRRFCRPLWISIAKRGVGGLRTTELPSVKCLHLQVGAWLGMGEHPAQSWLSDSIGPIDCPDRACSRFEENVF